MAATCLLQSEKDKLVEAINKGDLSLERLYHMGGDEARGVFGKIVGEDSAHAVNAEFQKAKIDATKKAAADYISNKDKAGFKSAATQGEFAKKLLNDEAKKKLAIGKIDEAIAKTKALQAKYAEKLKGATDPEAKANIQNKLAKLHDHEARLNARREDTQNPSTDRMLAKIQGMKDILGDSDYADLAAAKLGHDVSPAQGKYIVDQASKLQELAKGNANAPSGLTPEFTNARLNLDSYINSLNHNAPLSILRNLIDIGRNNLITGFSTPVKVLTNYTNFFGQKVLERIASGSFTGENGDLINALYKDATSFSKKTGNEFTQFKDANDIGSTLGSHSGQSFTSKESYANPEAAPGGKGILAKVDFGVGKAAQLSHFIAIKVEHTLAFNHVFRNTFYDTLKFRSASMAKLEGLKGSDAVTRAAEIIKDANKVEPQTEAGTSLRRAAQEVASVVTNTNDTYLSRLSVGLKNGINKMSPNVPVGDLIEPMAKIPANVISNALRNSPVGLPKAALDIIKGRLGMMESKTIEDRYAGLQQYKNGIEHLVGVVGSLGIAAIITSNLTKKDFRSDQYILLVSPLRLRG